MAESADTTRAGSPADRKTSVTTVTAVGTGAAGGAATLLWVLGCLKGHQFYTPDDALALFWAGLLAPAAMALYNKFNHWAGAS